MGKRKAGSKASKKHTTKIPAAEALVRAFEKMLWVTHFTLGEITPGLKPAKQRIKLTPMTGGLKATVRGASSVQVIMIFTTSSKKTEDALNRLFGK